MEVTLKAIIAVLLVVLLGCIYDGYRQVEVRERRVFAVICLSGWVLLLGAYMIALRMPQ